MSAFVAENLAMANPSPQQFEAILTHLKANLDPSTLATDLSSTISSLLSANLSMVQTRELLALFIDTLKTTTSDPSIRLQIAQQTLSLLESSQNASSLTEHCSTLLELIASAHEESEDFHAAAEALARIPLDGAGHNISDVERAKIWVRVVRDYLEEDESELAEPFLNKLKNVMHTVADPTLTLHFNLSQARINDAKREFLAAAARYHEISFSPAIAEDERLHTLAMAIKCAVLAPAGPLRSRALGRLYKDERSAQLGEFSMLEKMFFERLLSKEEVDTFAQGLQRHQLATTADGSTVLAKAVVEHNLLAASRLYANIGFDELGVLLGLPGDKAEDTTARMIEQGRLLGRMDQIERRIWFEGGEASGQKGSGRADVTVGKEMRRWASNVQGASEELENITNMLQKQFPNFVATNLLV